MQPEAGGRVLTTTILAHVVLNIIRNGVDVGVIPNFRMEASEFEDAATCYGHIVDFQIVSGLPDTISQDKYLVLFGR